MVKEFECLECGTRFKAEEEGDVLCSDCHSDNVQYARFRLPKWTKWAILGALGVATIIVAIIWLMPDSTNVEVPIDSEDEPPLTEEYKAETDLSIPASLVHGEPTFEENGYTFKVSIKNAPNCSLKYIIMEAFSNKVVAESSDGNFKDVPYSKDKGGVYRIVAKATAKDSILAEKEIAGFIKQMKVSKKMAIDELQLKIKTRDPSLLGVGENDYLSPTYTLSFSGLSSDAVNIPKVLAEVFDKLDMGTWSSIKVTGLEYDDMNRINVIKIKVTESNDEF